MKREEIEVGVIAFGVGVVVGGILALLFAPQSGKETRQFIKKEVAVVGEEAAKIRDKVTGKFKKGA